MTPAWIRIGRVLGRLCGMPAELAGRRAGLLVIHTGSLGDGLLFSGALRFLRRALPGRTITLVADRRAEPLFERCPDVDVFVVVGTDGDRGWLARGRRILQAARIFMRSYDMALCQDLIRGTSAEHLMRLVESKLRCTMEFRAGAVAVEAEGCAPQTVIPDCALEHQLDRTVFLLRSAGFDRVKSRDDIEPVTYINEADRRFAEREIQTLRKRRPDAVVVSVCAGARFKQKDWGAANYIELLRCLDSERPVSVILHGATGDRLAADAIEAGLLEKGGVAVLNMAGRTELHHSMALIGASDICLGNDTFGLHAAVALGTPSVVVMWGGDGERWAPWGGEKKHRMIRSRDLSCAGCGGECIHDEYRCMSSIKVADVLRAVLELPARRRSEAGAQ